MNTIDKLVLDLDLNLEKKGQKLPKNASEKIILLSTIDAWRAGIPFYCDHNSRFDSIVIGKAENYALRYAEDNSALDAYESKIKELLAEHAKEFRNYIKMNLLGVNQVFARALMTIKSEYAQDIL